MIKYDPKDAVQCLPEGQYSATLEEVTETQSKSGKPMHEMRFRVYGPNEREVVLTDWIVYPDSTWKLKKLAVAIGMEREFNAETFDPTACVSHNLVLDITIREWNGNDQNSVKGYSKSIMNATKSKADDDDLPF